MHIKVMPDYCSSGIWNVDPNDHESGYELDPVDLCFPLELIVRLDKCIELYDDATFRSKEPWEGGAEIDTAKLDAVNCECMYIAQEIKSIHPDWTVEAWLEMHDEGKLLSMMKMTITEVFKYKATYA